MYDMLEDNSVVLLNEEVGLSRCEFQEKSSNGRTQFPKERVFYGGDFVAVRKFLALSLSVSSSLHSSQGSPHSLFIVFHFTGMLPYNINLLLSKK